MCIRDSFIAEIIDPDTGEVLPEGSEGELVFTSITKKAFPLLRYRTRDICTLTREKCPCGRTHVKMSKPRGRTDDMLIIRGVNVFPSQIEKMCIRDRFISRIATLSPFFTPRERSMLATRLAFSSKTPQVISRR